METGERKGRNSKRSDQKQESLISRSGNEQQLSLPEKSHPYSEKRMNQSKERKGSIVQSSKNSLHQNQSGTESGSKHTSLEASQGIPCDKDFPSYLRTRMGSDGTFKCSRCGELFMSMKKLSSHLPYPLRNSSFHKKSDKDSRKEKNRTGESIGSFVLDSKNRLHQNQSGTDGGSVHASQEASPGISGDEDFPSPLPTRIRTGQGELWQKKSKMVSTDLACRHKFMSGENLLSQFPSPHQKYRSKHGDDRKWNIVGSEHKLCLLYGFTVGSWMTLVVIGVGENGLLHDSFSTLKLPHSIPGVGFGSLGSRCYVIGGNIYQVGASYKRENFPKDVYICDLNSEVMMWEEGPKLNDGKPDPIVVTVNGKLYVLAGYSEVWVRPGEQPQHVFEVFDPKCGAWKNLPDPPFLPLYKKGHPNPEFQGHTVIGSVIYFQVGKFGNPTLFAFNVNTEKWNKYGDCSGKSISRAGSDDLIFRNLRFGEWHGRAEVIDYLMFQTSEDQLEKFNTYAYDLTCKIEDFEDVIYGDSSAGLCFSEEEVSSDNERSIDKPNKYDLHDFEAEDYVLMVEDKLVTVPVLGLTLIDRDVPFYTRCDSFVIHLRDNLFAFVSSYPSITFDSERSECERIRACIFKTSVVELLDGSKVPERYVAAYNVKEMKWVKPSMGMLIDWCKVPNDGCQSQFRRPQLHYGTYSSSYQDHVAGQKVQKKNTSNNYVRRVNLPWWFEDHN